MDQDPILPRRRKYNSLEDLRRSATSGHQNEKEHAISELEIILMFGTKCEKTEAAKILISLIPTLEDQQHRISVYLTLIAHGDTNTKNHCITALKTMALDRTLSSQHRLQACKELTEIDESTVGDNIHPYLQELAYISEDQEEILENRITSCTILMVFLEETEDTKLQNHIIHTLKSILYNDNLNSKERERVEKLLSPHINTTASTTITTSEPTTTEIPLNSRPSIENLRFQAMFTIGEEREDAVNQLQTIANDKFTKPGNRLVACEALMSLEAEDIETKAKESLYEIASNPSTEEYIRITACEILITRNKNDARAISILREICANPHISECFKEIANQILNVSPPLISTTESVIIVEGEAEKNKPNTNKSSENNHIYKLTDIAKNEEEEIDKRLSACKELAGTNNNIIRAEVLRTLYSIINDNSTRTDYKIYACEIFLNSSPRRIINAEQRTKIEEILENIATSTTTKIEHRIYACEVISIINFHQAALLLINIAESVTIPIPNRILICQVLHRLGLEERACEILLKLANNEAFSVPCRIKLYKATAELDKSKLNRITIAQKLLYLVRDNSISFTYREEAMKAAEQIKSFITTAPPSITTVENATPVEEKILKLTSPQTAGERITLLEYANQILSSVTSGRNVIGNLWNTLEEAVVFLKRKFSFIPEEILNNENFLLYITELMSNDQSYFGNIYPGRKPDFNPWPHWDRGASNNQEDFGLPQLFNETSLITASDITGDHNSTTYAI